MAGCHEADFSVLKDSDVMEIVEIACNLTTKGWFVMIDEELTWQQREITGTAVRVCERCGRPIDATEMQMVDDETSADGGTGMRICADCMNAIARGADPVDLADDDLDPVY